MTGIIFLSSIFDLSGASLSQPQILSLPISDLSATASALLLHRSLSLIWQAVVKVHLLLNFPSFFGCLLLGISSYCCLSLAFAILLVVWVLVLLVNTFSGLLLALTNYNHSTLFIAMEASGDRLAAVSVGCN
ncbi:unnamed protein product [Prunus armeniaca]|uniref:Uncharacterized protein n=1 Tax=Prunus armeniaca TaxID=36596 RepID=A0A6J5V9Q6_PRUAR|nr:unnamed protein product [Prunus armeniaca]